MLEGREEFLYDFKGSLVLAGPTSSEVRPTV